MQQISTSTSFRRSLRRGAIIMALVADNHASKLAVKMARAMLRPRDELQLVTVVTNEDNINFGNSLLAAYVQEQCNNVVTPVVLLKGDEGILEVISTYVSSVKADLLVTGSQHLCIAGTRDNPMPASGSFALRIVKHIRHCPVLLVKANSKGPYLRSDNGGIGIKVMVDCQANSRHLVGWLIEQLDAEKDALFLAAVKAHDPGTGAVKETAARMLTNFSVQASVNDFFTAQRVFKESGTKALPQAVEADAIDILAVQAPECKMLPDSIIDLINVTKSSLLIYHYTEDTMSPLSGTSFKISAAASLAPDAMLTA